MIVSHSKRIVTFLPPKTGSTTICDYLFDKEDMGLDVIEHNHDNYIQFFKNCVNYKEYKFLCFYRDPVKKFISAWNHLKHVDEEIPYKNIEECIDDLNMKNAIELNLDKVAAELFYPQIYWLECPGIELFDFQNFPSEVVRMIKMYDQNHWVSDYDLNLIPKHPRTASRVYTEVTNSVEQKIKEYYSADYDFFASRGISFV